MLDDYLRLKKLFAARLVTKSTSGDQSSITEVGDREYRLTLAVVLSSSLPLGGAVSSLSFLHCRPVLFPGLQRALFHWSRPLSLLLCPLAASEGLSLL